MPSAVRKGKRHAQKEVVSSLPEDVVMQEMYRHLEWAKGMKAEYEQQVALCEERLHQFSVKDKLPMVAPKDVSADIAPVVEIPVRLKSRKKSHFSRRTAEDEKRVGLRRRDKKKIVANKAVEQQYPYDAFLPPLVPHAAPIPRIATPVELPPLKMVQLAGPNPAFAAKKVETIESQLRTEPRAGLFVWQVMQVHSKTQEILDEKERPGIETPPIPHRECQRDLASTPRSKRKDKAKRRNQPSKHQTPAKVDKTGQAPASAITLPIPPIAHRLEQIKSPRKTEAASALHALAPLERTITPQNNSNEPHDESAVKKGRASERSTSKPSSNDVDSLRFASTARKKSRRHGNGRSDSIYMTKILKEEAMSATFKRLQNDGEVHRDDLSKALELMGFSEPNATWVQEVVDSLTRYTTLNFQEFESFMENYGKRQDALDAKLFAEVDGNGSGAIDASELADIMIQGGFTPIRRVLDSIIAEISDSDHLTFNQFQQAVVKLRSREGFTKCEIQMFSSAFKKFDRGGTGRIETKDVGKLLVYLGYAAFEQEVSTICSEVDTTDTGSLLEREFLVCMRKVREREIAHMQRILKENTQDSRHALMEILTSLGYVPQADEVDDAVIEAGIDLEFLTFDTVWQVLDCYRSRMGFTRAETKMVRGVFQRLVRDDSHRLPISGVVPAFQLLGCRVSVATAQSMVARIDFDGSGLLNLTEFLTILRHYSRANIHKAWASFCGHAASAKEAFDIPDSSQLLDILRDAVPDTPPADLEEQIGYLEETFADAGKIRVDEFIASIGHLRSKARDFVQQHEGFGPTAVEQLQQQFKAFVKRGSSVIDGRGLHLLLEEFFNELATSAGLRPQLVEVMREADKDGSGTIDFGDFLRLARKVEDMQQQALLQRELDAIRDTGFCLQEVTDLRDFFLEGGDRDLISFDQLRDMLSRFVPMGTKNANALARAFEEKVTEKQGKFEADFPEFLTLIRCLTDANVANINRFAERALGGAAVLPPVSASPKRASHAPSPSASPKRAAQVSSPSASPKRAAQVSSPSASPKRTSHVPSPSASPKRASYVPSPSASPKRASQVPKLFKRCIST